MSTQELPLSSEQEREVLEWATKEKSGGTIIRRELIHWFAQRLIRRDGNVNELQPDFAGQFLHRHPDLAQLVVIPPPLSHEELQGPLRGLARLRAKMQLDRTEALYGQNPPPPRQHAPFPQGDLVYRCNYRHAVRHGNHLTKYTINPDGMGTNDHPNEAYVLRFIKEHTTIPVPEVISSDWDRVTMEYIEGQTLQQAWPILTPEQRSEILAQLRDYIAQLRALPGIYLGRFDGQGVLVPSILTRSGGPFRTIAELQEWLVQPPKRQESQSMYWRQITTQLGADYPIVFTHGDIAARNIIVRDGRIVALLDWECAGWYPDYWEHVFAIRGLDNVDWDTLGRHLPDLFARRYDLEYILMEFILSLS